METERFFNDQEFLDAYSTGLWFVTIPYYLPPDGDSLFGCTPLVALLVQEQPDFLENYPLVEMHRNSAPTIYNETKVGITLTKKRKSHTIELSYSCHPDFSFAMFRYFAETRKCEVEHVMGVQCGAARRTLYYTSKNGVKAVPPTPPDIICGSDDFRYGYIEGWLIRESLIDNNIKGSVDSK